MEKKFLVYAHPSVPPVNIKINVWYSLDELKERFDLEEIKHFFQPSNFAWEDLDKVDVKKNILVKDNK